MKNRLAILLLALVILASVPCEALAQRTVTFQNSTSYKLFVCMHYKHSSSGWLTHGWWPVEPNSSRTRTFDTDNNVVYLFAKNVDGEYVWSGEEDNSDDRDLYVASTPFEAMGQNKPKGEDVRLERFIYVEFTGDSVTYEFAE